MGNNLKELLTWFPSGTAEGERAILDRVFVYVDEFARVMAPPVGSPYLLVGKKGSGKSAILDFAIRVLKKQGVPSLLITPVDIDTSSLTLNESTGDMTRRFYEILLAAISVRMAQDSTGWFDRDEANLYYHAVQKGGMPPDMIGKFGQFLARAAKPLVKIDFSDAFPFLTQTTLKEVEGSISRVLGQNSFYIFLDDTDQVGSPDQPGHLNRIWALLLAVRRLTSTIDDLKVVVSLRTEVWERLKVDPSGQRDQTDHFSRLRISVESDRTHIQNIVERRLSLAAVNLKRAGLIYSPFFEGEFARAPFSEEHRSWKDLIVVRSRERPRDAIQLVNMLASKADHERRDSITEDDFRAVMPAFSQERAELFAQEVKLECPSAMEILRTFSDIEFEAGSFKMSAEQALEHFRRITSRFSVQLYGITLDQNSDRDIFELWRFFYLCNVINARVSDAAKKEGYRHLNPEDDVTLVSRVRWNELQQMLWEVNTAYRDFLIMLQQEKERKTGLPMKRRIRHRQPPRSGRRR